MQLLLETSADNQHYYCDSLKACLVTTVTSSGPSQSTIKLVATNMIANGKLAGEALSLCLSVLGWAIRNMSLYTLQETSAACRMTTVMLGELI